MLRFIRKQKIVCTIFYSLQTEYDLKVVSGLLLQSSLIDNCCFYR
jgi:hypothetical protein